MPAIQGHLRNAGIVSSREMQKCKLQIPTEQCWGSVSPVTFFLGESGSVDQRIRIRLSIRLPASVTSRMPQKNFFFIFFSYDLRYPPAHYHQSLTCCFKDKFCYNFILQTLFQSTQHRFEKGEGSESGRIITCDLTADPDPGGPKTGSGCGYPTLLQRQTRCEKIWLDKI